jgi:hypothetical protein
MKKMKIMLLSFAILAIVGGALAFKAKNTQSYCTALPEANGSCSVGGSVKACPGGTGSAQIQLTTAAQGTRFTYCYTTPLNGTDCKLEDGVTPITCIATTTSFRVDDPQ